MDDLLSAMDAICWLALICQFHLITAFATLFSDSLRQVTAGRKAKFNEFVVIGVTKGVHYGFQPVVRSFLLSYFLAYSQEEFTCRHDGGKPTDGM
jgi:hypothetical protein